MVLRRPRADGNIKSMDRVYESLIREHLREQRQMAFVTGPRQVGKTTSALASAESPNYINWDRQSDRLVLTRGPEAVAERLELATLGRGLPHVVFDEIHKYAKWKSFLKGFFDAHADECRSIVTGSARLSVRRRGGDSLMGRYFLYRMHPLSIAELLSADLPDAELRTPNSIGPEAFQQLLQFGGFPEPFLKGTARFYNRWKRLRVEQLFREDLRDLTRIHEAGQIEVLAQLLANQTGQLVNYSSLASEVNVAVDTVRRWVSVLESFYYCFVVRPWFRNIPKSLRKQPKIFLWDWGLLGDRGARHENFVASHLFKAVCWWTDMGLGEYGLYYLRDKAKREVDFLVTRDQTPWFLVEVKSSGRKQVSPNLEYFQGQLGAAHAFQVAFDLDYVERDCFSVRKPVRVPAVSLLSQLA